jgi:hypothetical protein
VYQADVLAAGGGGTAVEIAAIKAGVPVTLKLEVPLIRVKIMLLEITPDPMKNGFPIC